MVDYLAAEQSLTVVPVAGEHNRTFTKCSNRARLAGSAYCTWIDLLHAEGFSLDGSFALADFAVDSMGFLKGQYTLLVKVKRLAGNMRRNDMHTLAYVIQQEIHGGAGDLPADLSALLSLLRTYRRRIAPLVLNHCSHDVESMKSALFLKMHDRLKVLEVMDKNLFNQVIANISDSTTWKNIASLNVHIQHVMRYPRRQKQPKLTDFVIGVLVKAIATPYVATAAGLLLCRRNSQAHLEPDYSIDNGDQQAALFGACAALAAHETRTGLRNMDQSLATHVSRAIARVLEKKRYPLEQGMVAAVAAGTTVVMHPDPSKAFKIAVQAGKNTATNFAAAAAAGQPLVPPTRPSLMFIATNI
jgi:hypothetical protein